MSKVESLLGIFVTLVIGSIVAVAGSQGGAELNGFPIFAICALLAFSIQWAAYIPAYLTHTEVYYDLTGGITYISVIALAVLSQLFLGGDISQRTMLIAVLCALWAIRLASFLFLRIKKDGFDRRFNKMKYNALQFLMTWTLQGLWVIVTLSAGLAAMTSSEDIALGLMAYIGAVIWVVGFSIEVVADRQKSLFREHNKSGFIKTGLWSWSRHPNYFGEILLWLGIAVIAYPTLEGWRLLTLISPIFVFVLLVFVSGVKMLERSAFKRWGQDEAYLDYLSKTSVLIPLPPSRS
ncbi:MAG: steroid 5-alpha reductase family enzyme [Candidatus Azotimanducaceae bacterium]|jgi:steroid 5-alpha reductase family enzyme